MVELPWRRASVRGIEADIPRTLTFASAPAEPRVSEFN
jgi:hypothetical protein